MRQRRIGDRTVGAIGLGAIIALTRWIGAPADATPEHVTESDES